MQEASLQEKSDAKAPAQLLLLLKALRPKQWTKNLIIFCAILFSGNVHKLPLLGAVIACFLAFCLVSGAIYIFNDLRDVEADREHPVKRMRPLASGQLNAGFALAAAIILILGGLTISYLVRPTLAVVLLTYIGLNVLYSLVLKHVVILDVFSIAASFVLRAASGAVAIHVPMSAWFLLCVSLGALFLALDKRRQELKLLGASSSSHRKSLTKYSFDLLDRMESMILSSLLIAYAFYGFLSIHGQWMMLTVPFVLYGLMRYQQLSIQENITGAPEDVLRKDKPIQITVILWVVTSTLVVYKVPPYLLSCIAKSLDSLTIYH